MNSLNLKCTSLKHTTAKRKPRPSKFFSVRPLVNLSHHSGNMLDPFRFNMEQLQSKREDYKVLETRGKNLFKIKLGVRGRRQVRFSGVEGEIIIIKGPFFSCKYNSFLFRKCAGGLHAPISLSLILNKS